MHSTVHDFTVIIEQDEEGWYVATVPELSGCSTQGKTVPEVLERIREAIEVCLDAEPDMMPKTKFIGIQRVAIRA